MSSRPFPRPRRSVPFLVTFVLASLASLAFLASAATADDVPFDVTEDRPRCAHYDELKQPFFGTTHLHTGLSFDASIRFVPSTPREAYRFAKGEAPLPGVGPNGVVDLDKYENPRPIDWGVVTDHSEQFGSMGLCKSEKFIPGTFPDGIPESVKYSLDCQLLRGFYWEPGVHNQAQVKKAVEDGTLTDGAFMPPALKRNQASAAFSVLVMPSLAPGSRNVRLPVCEAGEENRDLCGRAELGVWQEIQAAAEEAYDRSPRCKFTSFVGYEAASTPSGTNWHRNVIFRNAEVVERPITSLDMAEESNPDPDTVPPQWLKAPAVEKLWNGLKEQCIDAEGNCDVLTIPHNSNLGGGVPSNPASGEYLVPPLFFDPRGETTAEQAADARARQEMEPLVEIFQDKGSSECRYDPRFAAGVGTSDELCDFEILDTTTLLGASGVGTGAGGGGLPPSAFDSRAYVRNVLKDGLYYQATLKVNPFKLGIVAASDSHNGTMGWHPENATYQGHEGIEDAIPVTTGGNIQNNSGGHSVVWAEENSRDAIFEALKRRETYGTSGIRPVVRFFGGWDEAIDSGLCGQDRRLAETGYAHGVPMGGDLEDAPSYDPAYGEDDANPRFIVAVRWDDVLRTPLQRAQIVKGWLEEDADGNLVTKESVIDVVVAEGSDKAGVDPETCRPTGPGAEYLCGVMEDTDFDPEQPAFYYARVLENPVCRYSTHICRKKFDLDPLSTSCANDLLKMQQTDPTKAAQAAMCCSNETTDYFVQPVIQERAWTSPIWYTPSADRSASVSASAAGAR